MRIFSFILLLLTSCNVNNPHVNEVDDYIYNIKANLVHVENKISDTSTVCYNRFNQNLIGWAYYYNRNSLYKKTLFVNDTLPYYSIFYDKNQKITEKKSMMVSPLEKTIILSEYLNYKDTIKSFAINLDIPDTVYTKINRDIKVNFSLIGDARSYDEKIIVTAVISDFFGNNARSLFDNEELLTNSLSFKISQYGVIKITFELKDYRKSTVFMERYLFILPNKYKNFDWMFIRNCQAIPETTVAQRSSLTNGK